MKIIEPNVTILDNNVERKEAKENSKPMHFWGIARNKNKNKNCKNCKYI